MSNESDEKVVIVRGHSLSIRQREASAVVAIFFSGGTSDPEGKKTSQERNGWRLVDHTAEMLLQKNPPATNANADRRAGRLGRSSSSGATMFLQRNRGERRWGCQGPDGD